MYANDRDDGQKIKNVYNNTFSGNGTINYAFFIQGQASEINFWNNTVSGYTRGINIHEESPLSEGNDPHLEANRAVVLISGNTISGTTEQAKGCLQMTNGKSAVIEYNTLTDITGNAIKFHEVGQFNDEVVVNGNYIEAEYILNIKSSKMPSIVSYGNILNIENPGMGINDDTGVVSKEGVIEGFTFTDDEKSWYDSNPEATEFTISSAKELLYLSILVMNGETFDGDLVKLDNDIDLSEIDWIPIGNNGREDEGTSLNNIRHFAGDFNGQNHVIRGLDSEGYGTGIPNSEGTFTYGLFGFVYGSDIGNVIIENASIDLGENSDSVGALIGYAIGDVKVHNVTVGGNISANDAVAGIIGRAYGSSISITDCINYANIVSTANNGKAGGIIAIASSACSDFDAVSCINNGNITCETGSAGGIAGYLGGSDGDTYTLTDCSNTGNIEGLYAGGATGYNTGSGKNTTITGNTGFSNTGSVSSDAYAGGAVGYWSGNGTVSNANNSGNITSTSAAGGIIGTINSGTVTISTSNVNGSPTISSTYAAGIVGIVGGDGTTIDGCSVSDTTTLDGTDDGVTDNSESVFYGAIEGVAVGKVREANLTIRNMTDVNNYELISATYFNGTDTVTLENCQTTNVMTWTSNYGTFHLVLSNSKLAGIEFSKTTLNITADGTSFIGKLVAGVDSLSDLLDKHSYKSDLSGIVVISSATTLKVNEFKADPVTSGHTWTSKNPAIKGEDNTSGLTVINGDSNTPYIWNGSEWDSSGVVTVTFKMWNGDSVVNLATGTTVGTFPESDRTGFSITGWKNNGVEWNQTDAVSENIELTPIWEFSDGTLEITTEGSLSDLNLSAEFPEYEGTDITYAWSGPDSASGDQPTFHPTASGEYTLTLSFTSINDTSLTKTLSSEITLCSVTFTDSVSEPIVYLVKSGDSISVDQYPLIPERDGYYSGTWMGAETDNITSDITVEAKWILNIDVEVVFSGELESGIVADVTTDYQPGSGVGLWYYMSAEGQDNMEQPVQNSSFTITEAGKYMFYVYAIEGTFDPNSMDNIVALGTSPSYAINEEGLPEEIFNVSKHGDNGTTTSNKHTTTISSDGYYNATIAIKFPDGTLTVSGHFEPGYYDFVYEAVTESVPDGYDYGFHVVTPISSIDRLVMDWKVNVPEEYYISEALVFREDDSGNITPVGEASYSNGMLRFEIDQNSYYWIQATYAPISDDPNNPDDPAVTPPSVDDDDPLPPVIRPGASSPSTDDDTVTIVACAAAVAVAAIMAVFLIMTYRKD